jgi:hypothetical protein
VHRNREREREKEREIFIFWTLIFLLLINIGYGVVSLVSPDSHGILLRAKDNRIADPGITIRFEKWYDIPDSLQRLVILRETLPWILYLITCFIVIYFLRRLYREVLIQKDYSLKNAVHIRRLGLALVLFTVIDFLAAMALNWTISLNSYTSSSSNIHVSNSLLPDFKFEFFIFGIIIVVISDIYLRVTEIEDDLKLTV